MGFLSGNVGSAHCTSQTLYGHEHARAGAKKWFDIAAATGANVMGSFQSCSIEWAALIFSQRWLASLKCPHLLAKTPQDGNAVHNKYRRLKGNIKQGEEIFGFFDVGNGIEKIHCFHADSGSKLNAFLLQVRPHASQPMQLSAFLTDANILADSSSSTSLGASTPWAQIFMHRPQPIHLLSSMALTNFGVHSWRPRVSPVMYDMFSFLSIPRRCVRCASGGQVHP
jgi:hypothetical protein